MHTTQRLQRKRSAGLLQYYAGRQYTIHKPGDTLCAVVNSLMAWAISIVLSAADNIKLVLCAEKHYACKMQSKVMNIKTRMVQLPATSAIEYVAACCRTRTRTRTRTKIGTITKIVRGAYARSPQVQCVYAPSRLSVPSIVA